MVSGGSASEIVSWEECGEKWVESKTKTKLLKLDGKKIFWLMLFTFTGFKFFIKKNFK